MARKIDPRVVRHRYVSGGNALRTVRRIGNQFLFKPLKNLLRGLPDLIKNTAINGLADQLLKSSIGSGLSAPDPNASAKIRKKVASIQSKYNY